MRLHASQKIIMINFAPFLTCSVERQLLIMSPVPPALALQYYRCEGEGESKAMGYYCQISASSPYPHPNLSIVSQAH